MVKSLRKNKKFTEKYGENFTIEVFGSSANSLWLDDSDIDLMITFPLHMDKNSVSLLKDVITPVRKIADHGKIEIVFVSRVPLLKFTEFYTKLQIDLTVNNTLPKANSRLLYQYCKFDQRSHILNIIIKKLFKKCNLIGTQQKYLSSFALSNLIIAFLQHSNVLPNFQDQISNPEFLTSSRREEGSKTKFEEHEVDVSFETDLDKVQQEFKGDTQKGVGQLLIEFFQFYLFEFKAKTQAISIYGGGIVEREGVGEDSYEILDPFDRSWDLGGSLNAGSSQMHKFRSKMRGFLNMFMEMEE